jgi:hypothetical protein
MSTFVDRLEDELIRAGYNRPRRYGRAVAGLALAAACVAAVLALALRTHAAPVPADHGTECPRGRTSGDEVDPRLLRSLAILRSPADPRDPAARCAETSVTGGPAYAGAARKVAPGFGGGTVYMVPVVHWSRADGAMTPRARAWRLLPGACLVTVGGPRFDPASFCASVREIPRAGAFLACRIPTEGPLAKELLDGGLPRKRLRGSFLTLIAPDGAAAFELRYRDGTARRAPVIDNTVLMTLPRSVAAATRARFSFFDARGRKIDFRR